MNCWEKHCRFSKVTMSRRKPTVYSSPSHAGRWPTQARFWLEWECSQVTDLVRRTKLDCPHAMGTDTFSTQRAESFRHFLLLPSPSVAYHGRKPTNLRVSIGTRPALLQPTRLRVRSHARAYSPPAQRTATGYAGRSAEVVEAGSIAAFDRRCGSFLAKAILRFQHSKLPAVCGEAALYSSKSGEGWVMRTSGGWEWSSFRHYATGCEGRVEIESEWTARKRERAAGRLRPVIELPHSSQNRA